MKRPVLIYVLPFVFALLSCNGREGQEPDVLGLFNVTFLDEDMPDRALTDLPAVDRLMIDVSESGSRDVRTYSYKVKDGVVEKGIDIPFKEGASYELHLWAQKSSGSVYTVRPGSLKEGASVKYPDRFKADDLASFDSYTGVARFSYPDGMPSEIRMKRNVARIDFVFTKERLAEDDVTEIEMTVEGLADKIPCPEEGSQSEGKAVYVLKDDASCFAGHEAYNDDPRFIRAGSGYLPTDGSCKVDVTMTMTDRQGNKVGSRVDDVIIIEAGMVTSLIFDGDKLIWKGVSGDVLPSTPSKDGWIHISSVSEFASLLAGGGQKGARYHICNDMDMSLLPSYIARDMGGTAVFEDICIDAGIYAGESVPVDYKVNPQGVRKIYNMEMPSAAGLFADVRGFEATNMLIENVIVGQESENQSGTGVLVGKSTGDLTLKNIKVTDSEVSAPCRVGGLVGAVYGGDVSINDCDLTSVNVATIYKKGVSGQAGGLIGYIGRSKDNDRSEEVDVNLYRCDLQGCRITAYMQSEELHSGRMVGTLSGYDRNEKVSFVLCYADDATLIVPKGEGRDDKARNTTGRYVNTYRSVFSDELPSEYEDLIGGQVYWRGRVRYGNYQVETQFKEFVPKWDGITAVTPLKADPDYDGNVKPGEANYMVYAPSDLIGLRGVTETPGALYLASDVDMNGQGYDGRFNIPANFADAYNESKDDNLFPPFKRVQLLEGNGKTIHNLAICQFNSRATAFILGANETTEHRNVNFRNCCVIGTHTEVEENSTAEAAIVCANASGTSYKMEKVNAYDCKVFGVQKIGTLISNLSADDSRISDCKVERSYIENYEVFIDEMFTGSFQYMDYAVIASKSFYPHGEVGGLIGFVSSNTFIENCNVVDSKINCYGLDDVGADIIPVQAATMLNVLGYYHIPGRHVSTLIGDIRTIDGESIQINGCKVDSKTKCTNRWDKYCWTTITNAHKTYPYIGSCYYVAFLDKVGTVFVDGYRINLADCRKSSVCYQHNIK